MPMLGLGITDAETPFHDSMRVRESGLSPSPVGLDEPTATQEVGDAHATELRKLSTLPGGNGVATEDQVAPSHDSSSADGRPVAVVDQPTAVHDLGDPQATACSTLAVPGVLTGTADHDVPSHDSAMA
ncbi:MAG: hypothetical protein ABI473_00250 [Candidatus Dormibacter sp.]